MIKQLFLLLLVGSAVGSVTAQDWSLIWADEFDYTGAPDPARWDYDIGAGGWGNIESQYYTERPENVRVDGDHLIIEARDEDFGGAAYTSARLVTRGKASWKYGRIEVRAMLPSGVGTWPAIWMLAEDSPYGVWPASGEIDIMEHVGKDHGRVHATLHMEARHSALGTQPSGSTTPSSVSANFHVYAVEWSPRVIRFYVDEQLVAIRAPGAPEEGEYVDPGLGYPYWPFDQPFHLLLNVAVGGTWGGPTIDAAAFPTQMTVDYVRVYEQTGTLPEIALDAVPATLEPGSTLDLTAAASDPDGQLESVAFFQGEIPLARYTGPPFAFSVPNVQPGCYELTAEATDTQGWVSSTQPSTLTIGMGCGQAPATISPHAIPGSVEAEYYDLGGNGVAYSELDATNSAGDFRSGESVEVARHSDQAGHYLTSIGRREWVEYTVDIQGGAYRVEAEVRGAGRFDVELDGVVVATLEVAGGTAWTTVSTTGVTLPDGVQVLRFQPREAGFELDKLTFIETGAVPVVNLVTPASGATALPGDHVTLTATATDADGDLSEVSFMQGIGTLARLVQPPFEWVAESVSEGCYSLSVRAVDSRQNVGATAPTEFRVGSACARAPYLMKPISLPGTVVSALFDLGDGHFDSSSNDGVHRAEPVDLAWDPEEGYYVTNIAAREWLGYTVTSPGAADYTVSARVRSPAGGTIQMKLGDTSVGPRLEIAPTGGLWETQTLGSVPLESGTLDLRMDARTAGFEIASLTFASSTATGLGTEQPIEFAVAAPFPNPTSGRVELSVTSSIHSPILTTVSDVFGRELRAQVHPPTSGTTGLTLDLSTLSSGIYVVSIQSGSRRLTRLVTVIR